MSSDEFENPWKTLSEKPVYENPWIAVSHHEVTTPGGTAGVYGVVSFKNHAVGVLPIDEQGGTWLVRQTRYPHGFQTWEIPEGGAPKGEPLLEAAQRELLEETGCTATHWEPWLELQTSNSVTDELATIYLAQGLSQQAELELDETEDITVHYVPLKQALTMVHEGEIVDSMSVAALLKVYADPRFKRFID